MRLEINEKKTEKVIIRVISRKLHNENEYVQRGTYNF